MSATLPLEQTGARRRSPDVVGRYEVDQCIAAGGMATVHLGRIRGAAGFSRTVAIKRLLPSYAMDPEFREMFVDEARVAARIQHANVAATLDVVSIGNELLLVMDYIDGETLAKLAFVTVRRGKRIEFGIIVGVLADALRGLHAAHTAKDRHGNPLGIVHRDVSPQNIIVGIDGSSRMLDFGIAKAADSSHTTREGLVKGKASYMAPEQIYGKELSAPTDVYSIGVILWELLTCERLYPKGVRPELVRGADLRTPNPLERDSTVPVKLAAVAMRALERKPEARYATAQEMAQALEAAYPPASRAAVSQWVKQMAAEALAQRAALVEAIESGADSIPPPAPAGSNAHNDSVSEGSFGQATGAEGSGLPRKLWLVATALALLVSGVAAGVFIARSGGNGTGATSVPAVQRNEAPAAPQTTPEPARASPAPAPSSVIDLDQPASVSQSEVTGLPPEPSADETESDAATKSQAAQTKAAKRPPRARRATKATNCTPPYRIDSAGRKHYKPECF